MKHQRNHHSAVLLRLSLEPSRLIGLPQLQLPQHLCREAGVAEQSAGLTSVVGGKHLADPYLN